MVDLADSLAGNVLERCWARVVPDLRIQLGIGVTSAWEQVEGDPMLPKQREFIDATEREVLYSGAFGAGKSRALCLKLVQRASFPGAREGLVRKCLQDLKASTIKTLLEPEGELPAVLRPGTFVHRKADKIIDLRPSGGGEIQYFGLDDPMKKGSYNLSGAAVDEACELFEEDWAMLIGRTRMRVPGLSNQRYGATNPGAPMHHLAIRFGASPGREAFPGTRMIRTRTDENHFLQADYVEDVGRFTGVRRRRYFEGEWAGAEGLVYDAFREEVHVMERSGPWRKIGIGVDQGYEHPFSAVLLYVDGDGCVHVRAEVYERRLQIRDKIRAVYGLLRIARDDAALEGWGEEGDAWDLLGVPVDPSAPDLIDAMTDAGLPAVKANNSVEDGLNRVRDLMPLRGNGQPRFTVDPDCVNWLREVSAYELRKDRTGTKETPVKEHDDLMDATRYGVWFLEEEVSDGLGVFFM